MVAYGHISKVLVTPPFQAVATGHRCARWCSLPTLEVLIFSSPLLLGVLQLLACTIASTSILYFCRGTPGPGYWAACCWLLSISYGLFWLDHFDNGYQLDWLIDPLLIMAQAIMMIGVMRFLHQPLPHWIIGLSGLAMLAMDLAMINGYASQALVDATYSGLLVLLGLVPIRSLWRSGEPPPLRNFLLTALFCYSLVHQLRLLMALQQGHAGTFTFLPEDSVPLLSFYSGLPFLVFALVVLTAMSLHRSLAESYRNASLAQEHLQRFEQLMHISSAATLLLRDGRIADSNHKLGELFGCHSEKLRGLPFQQLFLAPGDNVQMVLEGDELPKNLIAQRPDQSTFQSEVTLKRLDSRHELAEIRDISRQKAMEAKLEQLAQTDPLTGALNRRAFAERFAQEQTVACLEHQPMCLAVLDLDHFKQINDTFGHGAGDEVLVQFSVLCRQQVRNRDVFARFGGEEFLLLLPDCSPTEAIGLLNRLRSALQEKPLNGLPQEQRLTFSAGVAACMPEQPLDEVLRATDAALYRAKRNGRNRVEEAEYAAS